ncbi:MAG: putative Zn-dependent protease [Rhodothermales bacterium]|jgi:predicted Zn-dependent protease
MLKRLALIVFTLSLPHLEAAGQIVRPPELRLQFHRAERAFRAGSSANEAKSRLDLVIAGLPHDAEALMLRAKVLLAMERPEAAFADAKLAAELMPGNGEAHLLVCETARESGDVAEALRALGRAAALITGGPDLHIRLSQNAQLLGELDQAEAYARVAHTQDETLPEAAYQLARVFLAKGRPDAAATIIAGGLEDGVLSAAEVSRDKDLEALTTRPELAAWFGR